MRLTCAALCLAFLIVAFDQHSFSAEPGIRVYFSPHGGCTQAVVAEIGKAKKEVLVQAYSFTSKPIAEALIAAHRKGVSVAVLADRSDIGGSATVLPALKAAGVPTFIDAAHPIAHAKIMCIDGHTVICGSFNWSNQAEANSEDLLVISSAELAKEFKVNWQKHRDHCTPYVRPLLRPRRAA